MAVTVTTDLVIRHAMDAIVGTVGFGGVGAPVAADTATFVQGTGAARSRHNAAGIGGIAGEFTAVDVNDLHIFSWANALNNATTPGGWRIRVADTNANIAANFGEWTVGEAADKLGPIDGFQRWCIDTQRPFDFVTGTPPALSAVGAIAIVINALNFSGRETFFADSDDTATGITIAGGTTASPGISSEIASNDKTNGRGIFKNLGGIYYILGRVTIGDTGATASEFADSNEVWDFEKQNVSATFHKIECVGGAGVNNIKFGIKSGTGTAAEAAGGNTFKATGLAPFRVQAIDANADLVGFYGCSFTNPVALKADPLRAFQFATAADAFTDQTREANNATINDMSFMPAVEAVGDKAVFGHAEIFSQLKINVGTAGVGGVVAWEYWTGAAWAALTSVTDGTVNFTVAGTNLVTYAIPNDWATTTLGGRGPYYYIRSRVTTVYSTNPLGTQAFCVMGGRVRLETANAEAIRCTFTNCDTIKIRSGAFLKKCTITDSVAPPKSAALDLGAADPAADTVRDLTIQNCARGILLNPTATATYNFRAIKFSNNAVVSAAIQEDAAPAGFVNLTTAANDATANDVGFFPVAPAVSDAFYIGYHSQFDKVQINVGTAGAGTYTVTWQYFTGTVWAALVGVTDSTTAFKTAGTNLLTFTTPSDWAKNTVNSQGPFFYIRALRDGGTETIRPLGTQVRAGFDVRVDAPGAATITINVLESGTTPIVDNVNNSTIVINNAVNITFTVVDKDNVLINTAQVAVYRTSDNLELMNEDTGPPNADGVATQSFNFVADTAIYYRVRKSSAAATRFIPVSGTGTITSSGLSVTVTLLVDTTAV